MSLGSIELSLTDGGHWRGDEARLMLIAMRQRAFGTRLDAHEDLLPSIVPVTCDRLRNASRSA